MSATDWDYTHADLFQALQRAGVERGDTVFFHVGADTLGQLKDATTTSQACELLYDCLREAVGPDGTILVPTYTFSFCNRQNFDVQKTPTEGGPWSTFAPFLEYVRTLPGAFRSGDPIHSVAGIGPKAEELLADVPNTCFGRGSVHDRLMQAGGKICTIGVGLDEATFRHFAEEVARVPFRFKKLFTGHIRNNGVSKKQGWIYNVRMWADAAYPDGTRLEATARENGVCRFEPVGRGELSVVDAKAYYDLTIQALSEDPWATAKGPAGDPVALDLERCGSRKFDVELSPNASMAEMVDKLWSLPRDIISDAYDASLEALATQLPMTIHEYETGTECWSWIVPEKWACQEAYLETMDGKRLFSYEDSPLHVVSYSLPYEGVVSREELLKHLHSHWRLRDAVPFIFKYYERDWGLCCTREMKESLADDEYRVVIKTTFSYGRMKVGEVVAKGQTDETIILCAHLCHPAMANDDMAGVSVGMQVMRELQKRTDLRYTYRYLIVPETIGSIAYLHHNADLVPNLKGGLFLEMLGLRNPHGLQLSFEANTELDDCFTLALKASDFHGWTGKYRTVIGNDERQFNGPGMRVPMLSLSRVLPDSSPDWPYPEYHSDHDNPDVLSHHNLDASAKLALRMIDTLENNKVPKNNFKGEVFCSRYGIFIDGYANPQGNMQLFNIMDHIDGTRTIAQIAKACEVSFDAVKGVVDELLRYGLVEVD